MNDNQNELLQKAIAELKNSPTVDIKGKSYTQVSTRINVFRKYFPTASIETLITYNDDVRVIIQTKISLNDRIIATGYAEEVRGDGNYINQTSAVENCETSSIGRALSNLGLGGSEYASANELENALAQQEQIKQNNNQRTTNQQTYQPQRQANQRQQYQHQNDFSNIINAGLQVIDNGDVLVVSGDGIFEKKSIIKNAGFRWDGQNRVWYMQKREAA
ncbi:MULTISPECIES: hypothetical protein [Aliarcobacter]|uniref:hypothetical protein n=1 Tax=Aliarcobacter TaxID=2321111 RepID=UPI0021B614B2|nr:MULTISPECIES: hypothetical protein [Aliarcobacter]MCT7482114.1 hypothetical protein [Aliarcobacter cryaerophilus]MCT7638013.1 hypothetical protein [Aliarcobacter butzleri]